MLEGHDDGGGFDISEVASIGNGVYEKGGVRGHVIALIVLFFKEFVNALKVEKSTTLVEVGGEASGNSISTNIIDSYFETIIIEEREIVEIDLLSSIVIVHVVVKISMLMLHVTWINVIPLIDGKSTV